MHEIIIFLYIVESLIVSTERVIDLINRYYRKP
ncbi:hypothetical protein EDD66_10814 [Mobilisporobacter senegalensis]|uniref:Uncharacterized protein n=1 Tax=Mobilisporobacter senegalensis TaxID=1329262 RepID=A0A3N1XMH7_9FIRM|nr:hypothetical protein EDD66_10814 [Mobilisporobacter senegalensis]